VKLSRGKNVQRKNVSQQEIYQDEAKEHSGLLTPIARLEQLGDMNGGKTPRSPIALSLLSHHYSPCGPRQTHFHLKRQRLLEKLKPSFVPVCALLPNSTQIYELFNAQVPSFPSASSWFLLGKRSPAELAV
jgi:hypothetical protein